MLGGTPDLGPVGWGVIYCCNLVVKVIFISLRWLTND
jgi:hypothetical protein